MAQQPNMAQPATVDELPSSLTEAVIDLETTLREARQPIRDGLQVLELFGSNLTKMRAANAAQVVDFFADVVKKFEQFANTTNAANAAILQFNDARTLINDQAAQIVTRQQELEEEHSQKVRELEAAQRTAEDAEKAAKEREEEAEKMNAEREEHIKKFKYLQESAERQEKERADRDRRAQDENAELKANVETLRSQKRDVEEQLKKCRDKAVSGDEHMRDQIEAAKSQGAQAKEKELEEHYKQLKLDLHEHDGATQRRLNEQIAEAISKRDAQQAKAEQLSRELSDLKLEHAQCGAKETIIRTDHQQELQQVEQGLKSSCEREMAKIKEAHREEMDRLAGVAKMADKIQAENQHFHGVLQENHRQEMGRRDQMADNIQVENRRFVEEIMASTRTSADTLGASLTQILQDINTRFEANTLAPMWGAIQEQHKSFVDAVDAFNISSNSYNAAADEFEAVRRGVEGLVTQAQGYNTELADVRRDVEGLVGRLGEVVNVIKTEADHAKEYKKGVEDHVVRARSKINLEQAKHELRSEVTTKALLELQSVRDTWSNMIEKHRKEVEPQLAVLRRLNEDLGRRRETLYTANQGLTAANRDLNEQVRGLQDTVDGQKEAYDKLQKAYGDVRKERKFWEQRAHECEMNGSQMPDPERMLYEQRLQGYEIAQQGGFRMLTAQFREMERFEEVLDQRMGLREIVGGGGGGGEGGGGGGDGGGGPGPSQGGGAPGAAGSGGVAGVGPAPSGGRPSGGRPSGGAAGLSGAAGLDAAALVAADIDAAALVAAGLDPAGLGAAGPSGATGAADRDSDMYGSAADHPGPSDQPASPSPVLGESEPRPVSPIQTGLEASESAQSLASDGTAKRAREHTGETPDRSLKAKTDKGGSLFRRRKGPEKDGSPKKKSRRPGSPGIGGWLALFNPPGEEGPEAVGPSVEGPQVPELTGAAVEDDGLGAAERRHLGGNIRRRSMDMLSSFGRAIAPTRSPPPIMQVGIHPGGPAIRFFNMVELPDDLSMAERNGIVSDFNRNTNEIGFLMDREATGFHERGMQLIVVKPPRCMHSLLAKTTKYNEDRLEPCPECVASGATCWYATLLPGLEKYEPPETWKAQKKAKPKTKTYPDAREYETINKKRWKIGVRRVGDGGRQESQPAQDLRQATSTSTIRTMMTRRSKKDKGKEKADEQGGGGD